MNKHWQNLGLLFEISPWEIGVVKTEGQTGVELTAGLRVSRRRRSTKISASHISIMGEKVNPKDPDFFKSLKDTRQKSLCEKHGVYIGNCILEKDQSDFYDTVLLAGPGPNQVWAHRKIQAPGHESYLFKGAGINSNVFETPMGKIQPWVAASFLNMLARPVARV